MLEVMVILKYCSVCFSGCSLYTNSQCINGNWQSSIHTHACCSAVLAHTAPYPFGISRVLAMQRVSFAVIYTHVSLCLTAIADMRGHLGLTLQTKN